MSWRIYFFSIRTFGPPTRVHSNRGSKFEGAVKSFLKKCVIQNIESRQYHPQCQGKLERSHDTWKTKEISFAVTISSIHFIYRRKNVGGFFVVISRTIQYLTSSFARTRKESFWSVFGEKVQFRFVTTKRRAQRKRRNW